MSTIGKKPPPSPQTGGHPPETTNEEAISPPSNGKGLTPSTPVKELSPLSHSAFEGSGWDAEKLRTLKAAVLFGEQSVSASDIDRVKLTVATRPSSLEHLTFRSGLTRALYPEDKNIVKKMAMVIVLTLLSPFTLLFSLLEFTRNCLQTARFVSPPSPKESPKEPPTKARDLSFISANVACMPGPVSVLLNRLPPAPERVSLLANHLCDQKGEEPDFVCLQESFVENTSLCQALVEQGYFVIGGIRGVGLNSGLVVASKTPIESAGFYQFKARRGEDALAKKGALIFSTTVNNKRIVVANAHLQAKFGAKYAAVRYQQFGELKKSIELFVAEQHLEGCPIMLMGDFNFPYQVHDEQEPGEVYQEEERKYIQAAYSDAGYTDYTNDPNHPGMPLIDSWLGPPTPGSDTERVPLADTAYDAFLGKNLGDQYGISLSTLEDLHGLSDHAALRIHLKLTEDVRMKENDS